MNRLIKEMLKWPLLVAVVCWLAKCVIGVVDPGSVSLFLEALFAVGVIAFLAGFRGARWMLLVIVLMEIYAIWAIRVGAGFAANEVAVLLLSGAQIAALLALTRDRTNFENPQPR